MQSIASRIRLPLIGRRNAVAKRDALVVLHETLRRERARADRTGSEFCLVTFYPTKLSERSAAWNRVVNVLRGRTRNADISGTIDRERAWLLLSDCSVQSAVRVAEEIRATLEREGIVLTHEVSHHGSSESASVGDSRTESRDGFDNDDDRSESPCDAHWSSARSSEENLTGVQAAQAFFVQAMPRRKRWLDVALAIGSLVAFAPVLALIAVAIKTFSRGPVFFSQWRTGRGGMPFLMHKFRTMTVDAEARKADLLALNERDGPAFKIEADPRVTWIGKILRALNLDELPQLWNVLRGEMSLVGPRPLPCDESAACTDWQLERLDVVPGITCFWQVSKRRAQVPFTEWMRMDIQYARTPSLRTDLGLIVKTFGRMIPSVRSRRSVKE